MKFLESFIGLYLNLMCIYSVIQMTRSLAVIHCICEFAGPLIPEVGHQAVNTSLWERQPSGGIPSFYLSVRGHFEC